MFKTGQKELDIGLYMVYQLHLIVHVKQHLPQVMTDRLCFYGNKHNLSIEYLDLGSVKNVTTSAKSPEILEHKWLKWLNNIRNNSYYGNVTALARYSSAT